MKLSMFVALVVAGMLLNPTAYASPGTTLGQSGSNGYGATSHNAWERARGIRPTFGGSVRPEPVSKHLFGAGGRPLLSRNTWRKRSPGIELVSVGSVGEELATQNSLLKRHR